MCFQLSNEAGEDLCPTPRGGRDQRRRVDNKVVEREATAGAHTRNGRRYPRSTNSNIILFLNIEGGGLG
jgi:hypothetical protein